MWQAPIRIVTVETFICYANLACQLRPSYLRTCDGVGTREALSHRSRILSNSVNGWAGKRCSPDSSYVSKYMVVVLRFRGRVVAQNGSIQSLTSKYCRR